MDKEQLFTFKQRAEELIKALKRAATKKRQEELERIKEILSKNTSSS
jgi:hypothetical protein